ncbi:fibrinogen C domain-containing protein 1-B-like isoform X2 [Ischnura elegans]|nr:fibrinogen C domain-containing protein 1-B-like isoform X2 [Ischnura elegans]
MILKNSLIVLAIYLLHDVHSQVANMTASTTSQPWPIPTVINGTLAAPDVETTTKPSRIVTAEEPNALTNLRKLDDHSLYLLQRISDRLTALMALDEQQLRRLEALEHRMTRLESQNLDRVEGIRTNVAEMNRRMQDMEREFESTKTVLDLLHQDAMGLRRGQAQIRREILKCNGIRARAEDVKESVTSQGEIGQSDLLSKIQLLTPTVYGILGSIGSLQGDISALRQNLSQIANMTRYVSERTRNLVTKDYLSILLADAKQESASPAKTLLFPQQQLYMMSADLFSKANEILPADCAEVFFMLPPKNQTDKKGKTRDDKLSGVYRIQPKWSSRPFLVYCDMETRGGGWTVFQNRYEGTVEFFRNWQDYKNGFGNLAGEFWLGLEKLHLLTNFRVNEILIELEDFDHEMTYAKFSSFAIGSEAEGYHISLLGDYEGTAGDSFSYHVGMKFSTLDLDKDQWGDGSCATSHSGAWWYRGCEASNLNGRYLNGYLPPEYEHQGIYWQDWHGPQYSLMKTRMAIRPIDWEMQKLRRDHGKDVSSSD